MKKINDTIFEASFCPVTTMLEEQAAAHPNKTAVICGESSLTYGEFNEAVNRVAHSLISMGVGREKIVAVMMKRGIDVYIAQNAILKAGRAFLIISPKYPKDRVSFILEDAGASHLITDEAGKEVWDSFGDMSHTEAFLIDELLKSQDKSNPKIEILEHDLCYCIYTSGSTGRPKGVMLEHGNLFNFVHANPKNYEAIGIVERASVVLALAAMTFDVSVMEEFLSLSNGLTVVIATEEEIHDIPVLAKVMDKNGVDAVVTTPSFLNVMLEFSTMRNALKRVVSYDLGAEAFIPALFGKIMELNPSAHIMNGYGPTEATISCTMKVIDSEDNITIGVPNANVFAYVVDERVNEVSQGEKGELLICGKGVGRGYINLPDKTKEAFITFNGMRGYRTGDIVRINSEGEIEFFGRKDNQIKLRGLRIELGEIEEVILSYEGIKNAIVVPIDDSYLCAYFTANGEINTDKLSDYAASHLAYYMVPDVFVALDEMPLTANMKVDKKALPKPVFKQGEVDVPKNPIQQRIYDIVSEVTKNTGFGISTPFFRVGLSSLGTMRLNVRLSEEFGVVVRSSDVNKYNTVLLMEEYLSKAQAVCEREVRESYPLTGSQKGIFAQCLKQPESTFYNIPFLFSLDREIDENLLALALKAVVKAHPYMNAVFGISDNGELCQKMGDENFEPKITSLSEAEFENKKSELVKPFKLEGGRLYRLEIFITENAKYLFVDLHHILADGNSYDIFFEDLDKAYKGEILKEENYSGFDVAVSEEYELKGGAAGKAIEYYDSIFAGVEAQSLPLFDEKEGVSAKGLYSQKLDISPDEAKELSDKLGVTLNTLFTGIFGIVAARFANAHDALFTTIYNGRNDSRLENTICMLVKTLPVYVSFDSSTTLQTYMYKLNEQLMTSMANDIYPFADIAARYGITSDLIFSYQAELSDDYPLGEFMAKGVDLSLDMPKEPLVLQVRLRDGAYYLEAEYRSDLYRKETIDSILSSYDAAITSARFEKMTENISILSKEQIKLLDSFNETDVVYEDEKSVVEMFESACAAYPEKTAVVYNDKSLSYAKLDKITKNLAGYIKGKKIGRENVVAVLIPRGEYMPICALGAARAGCAYQPLDPTYPKERLAFMAEDSKTRLLITTKELESLIPEFMGDKLYLEDILSLPDYVGELTYPQSSDMFILLYTSGSTGVPKGVVMEFGNIAAFCRQYHSMYSMDSESRSIAYASFGFDASMMDIFTPLTVGAELHIIDESIRLDLIALNDYFTKNKITHAFMTTQVGRQFAVTMENDTLKYLSTGGEKLVPLNPPKGYKLINIYGPTEATVFVTHFEVDKYYENIPIGSGVDNIKLYVVDDKGRRLPAGACGELVLAGPQVARGYLNRPEKTAEVFLDNPFSADEKYRRMYRTGDVVRFLTDGNVSFVGRRDAQVKIRGFRIELTEIEEVIRRFPGIKDATATAFDEEGGGKFIAAYVVADNPVDIDALNTFIAEEKPAYMVPAVTMQIDAIPLNQNQKVNKRALPKPERKKEELVEPKTENQKRIFECVADAIGHREFGITTNIYAAGLTSISAIRLNVLLSKEFNAVIKTGDLKNNDTIIKLESFLLGATGIKKHEKRDSYPLTTTQEGVFVDCMANMGTTVYNIPYLFKLSKNVDISKLKKAIEQVVKAYPYLKARLFMDDKGNICQKPMEDEPFEVSIYNSMDSAKLVRPFNLFGERLFRFEIYREYDANYLFMDIHHLIVDGSSYSILLSSIDDAYAGKEIAKESYTSFDLACDNEKAKLSGEYEKAKSFFEEIFADKGGSATIYPDKNEKEPKVGTLKVLADKISVKSVEEICKKYGITENVFFSAAFGIMLSRYQFKDESVFTTIYHGRNDSRLTDTIGMLVKTLPVYCKVLPDTGEYFKEVQNELMGMMDHDIYPFSEISAKFGIKPDMMLVYQGDNFEFDTLCGEKVEEVRLELNAAKAPISVMISKTDKGYEFELEYRGDMYEEETIGYIVENLLQTVVLLTQGVSPSNIRLMFDEQEKMTDVLDFTGSTFPKRFAQMVAKYPDNIALKDEKGVITYKELDAMSDYVACKLTKKGFGLEQTAGVLCGRTSEFMIAVVGIMKAGGAYVPLDPEYPKDRLEYMLSDSGSKNLLVMSDLLSLVDFYEGNVITLDNVRSEGGDFSANDKGYNLSEVNEFVAGENNLAYMIYTSGSTGKPKGVMLEQRNLMNLMANEIISFDINEKDMVAEYASFCFDASVIGLFLPLCCGATLYIFPEHARKDVMEVVKIFNSEPITIAAMPTQMGELAAGLLGDDCHLRYLTLGGEKFKRYQDKKFLMVNGYGPTENTVSSTEFVVDKAYKNIPIGKAQLNVRCYCLDEEGNRVPIGAPGELCLAGRQVARGYHNLPEKTAASFTRNPYACCPEEERLYHTGDMVRIKGDGNIEYVGRIDSQVKVRGFRVELGEIEGAILTAENVVEAACIAVEMNGINTISAYYTGSKYTDQWWREYLAPRIPDYMVPSFFTHLEKMPITPGGKIDKRSLPLPKTNERKDFIKPQTTEQKKLAEIFANALGIEKVSIDDDFFAIGGSSLVASKVAVMCMMENIPLVYADIFKYPTVRGLAAVISGGEEEPENKDEFADYDYGRIDDVIRANDVKNADNAAGGENEKIGNVLLTGATGFLGIHVLREFISNFEGKVYCLVRKGRYDNPELRLKNMLVYYFENSYDELFGERIFCIDGDITDKTIVETLKEVEFDTLINCAASVKHFAAGDLLERINYLAVENLICLCEETNRRLVQISTVSTGGEGMGDKPGVGRRFAESDLYISQRITNEYIRTKFLAERAVLEACTRGLDGKIVRVGNLMGRDSDGEFQVNFVTNGFLRTLRGYKAVGAFPMSSMGENAEFSPIDSTALAVLKVSGTGKNATVFHCCNSHRIYMSDVIAVMKECGFDIDVVSDSEFEKRVNDYATKHENTTPVSGLIAYLSREEDDIYTIDYTNTFTNEVLYRLGYRWPITDSSYLKKVIISLETIGFFDEDLLEE